MTSPTFSLSRLRNEDVTRGMHYYFYVHKILDPVIENVRSDYRSSNFVFVVGGVCGGRGRNEGVEYKFVKNDIMRMLCVEQLSERSIFPVFCSLG